MGQRKKQRLKWRKRRDLRHCSSDHKPLQVHTQERTSQNNLVRRDVFQNLSIFCLADSLHVIYRSVHQSHILITLPGDPIPRDSPLAAWAGAAAGAAAAAGVSPGGNNRRRLALGGSSTRRSNRSTSRRRRRRRRRCPASVVDRGLAERVMRFPAPQGHDGIQPRLQQAVRAGGLALETVKGDEDVWKWT